MTKKTRKAPETKKQKEELSDRKNKQEEKNQVEAQVKDKPADTPEEKPAEEEEKKSSEEIIQEQKDKYLRLSAEFDNYRKRTLKEKMELTKLAGEDILMKLLPVMDDFERALQSMNETTDCIAMKQGIDLIYSKFNEFLKANGIHEIEAINKTFDTDVHEAITKIPAPSKKMKGKVVDVIERGYYLHDKVIRFAKVVIGE